MSLKPRCSAVAICTVVLMAVGGVHATDVRVIDGDTIEIGSTTYRLHGIDAPEAGQKCLNGKGKKWTCGKQAVAALEAMVLGKAVTCDNRGTDGYGRVIGVCRAGGIDVNRAMVADGHAWAFRRFSDDYAATEDGAKVKGLGVFQADTQTPWEYRSAKWEVGVQQSPDGCPIKGNISRNGKIYHPPWSPWYTRTKISIDKGERWFCDESEAVEAGWRAPRWGRT